jgi:choline dehydrogenase
LRATGYADVVVVGAGSCGGVVASRLSEDERCQVVLVEAGADFPNEATAPWPWMTIGSGLGGVSLGPPVPEMDWDVHSEPLSSGRRIPLPRGKVVGGSSMVNGCIAVRGRPSDFDGWLKAGAVGWGWSDVQPIFERVENAIGLRQAPRSRWLPVQDLLISGFEQLGFRWVRDMNAADSWDGVVGPWPQNIINGIRGGALVNYIRWARQRPNFQIREKALVDKVLMHGARAVGVEYIDHEGARSTVRAERIVLAAGTFATPAILMRSGIGPADHLRSLGINVVADLPVGRGLSDHASCGFKLVLPPEYARMGTPMRAAVVRGRGWFGAPLALDEEEGLCSLGVVLSNLESNGRLWLASSDPSTRPVVDLAFQNVIDRKLFEPAWQAFFELLETPALRAAGARPAEDPESLDDLLQKRMSSGHHAVGGCPIGTVVTPQLAVLGTESLYVIDGSVFPTNVTNNTNLTCLVVGERGAEFLSGSDASMRR